jgi:hypothetical protein
MAVHPLTYAYLASRYTLTSTLTVRCRRAWYQARVHPSASGPSEPRRRWLEKRFPKRSKAGAVTSDHHRYAAGVGNSHEQIHPRQPPGHNLLPIELKGFDSLAELALDSRGGLPRSRP